MKKTNKFFMLALLSGALIFTSCDDEKEQLDNPSNNTTTTPTTNGPLSVEQNKANMEASGMEMVNNMREMKNSTAITVSTHLLKLMSNNEPAAMKNGAFKMFYALRNFQKSGDIYSVYANMRSVAVDPSSPQEAFDEIKGTYTYQNGEWEKTENNAALVVLFPTSDASTTNDGNLTLTYLAYNGKKPFEDYEGDLPYKINAVLKRNTTDLITYNFEANYDNDGAPTSVNSAMQIEAYKMEMKVNRGNTASGFSYSFKKGTEVYLEASANAEGNFSNDNIENLAKDSLDEKIEDITKIATKLGANLQVMRYNLKGEVNIEGLINDIKAAGGSEEISQEKAVELINKYYNLNIYDTKNNNAIVAGTEFYIEKETNTYTKQVWNETTQSYDDVTETSVNEYVNIRMKFADGSKSDIETYFKNGFDKLVDEVKNFMTELEGDLDS